MKTIIKENGTEITKMTREETGITDTPWMTEKDRFIRNHVATCKKHHPETTKEEAIKSAKEMWEWAT